MKIEDLSDGMRKRMEKGQINEEDIPYYERIMNLNGLGKTNTQRVRAILLKIFSDHNSESNGS